MNLFLSRMGTSNDTKRNSLSPPSGGEGDKVHKWVHSILIEDFDSPQTVILIKSQMELSDKFSFIAIPFIPYGKLYKTT